MSSGDTARLYHTMARSELIQRIQLRDHVLMAFLGGLESATPDCGMDEQ